MWPFSMHNKPYTVHVNVSGSLPESVLTGSMRKTWEAAVKLSPTPPALSDRSMITGLWAAELWNSWMTWVLLFWLMVPSKRTKLKPCSLVKRREYRADKFIKSGNSLLKSCGALLTYIQTTKTDFWKSWPSTVNVYFTWVDSLVWWGSV